MDLNDIEYPDPCPLVEGDDEFEEINEEELEEVMDEEDEVDVNEVGANFLRETSGDSTFLKDDKEPFDFHCMRYYLPNIARETFDKHKLGLGIFTMQGFEKFLTNLTKSIHQKCVKVINLGANPMDGIVFE